MRWIMARVFGWQYVVLIDFQGKLYIRRVRRVGDFRLARLYWILPETDMHLLPHGKKQYGPSYINGWAPVTQGMKRYFEATT